MHIEDKAAAVESFYDFCRGNHLRITPQRTAVYQALMDLRKQHPSAELMYRRVRRQIPNISYDTVNRILLKFAEFGLVDVVEGQGGPRRFDPDRKNHNHFHCTRCGRIVDFPGEEIENIEVPGDIDKRFRILTRRIVLTGICDECLASRGKDCGTKTAS